MSHEKSYFLIDREHLEPAVNELYPFHLYVHNPANQKYATFLHANSPVTLEGLEFLDYVLMRGGSLAISFNQKNTFLQEKNLKEEDITDLLTPQEHSFVTKQKERKEKREKKKQEEGPFHFKDELAKALKNDQWMPLIKEAREEVMSFPFTISHTVSLSVFFAEKLMTEDHYLNRLVALTFHLAVGSGMKDPLALGEVLVAAYLSHLGHTQLDLLYSQKAFLELTDKQRREYKKHPGLAQHLIRKSGLIISERCNKILYQHHERFDGSGYPEYKQSSFIEPLALILGASAHIMEYTTGKITGSPVAMVAVIKNLKEKTLSPGLELGFGDTIYESLIYLLETNKESAGPSQEKVAA